MARDLAAPYVAAGRWKTFGDGDVPVPGIKAILIPGHTPGHTAYKVGNGRESLVITGDMIHSLAVQFQRPDVAVAFDTDQREAVSTRLALFKSAAERKALIAGMHLPFPGIGRIRKDQAMTFSRNVTLREFATALPIVRLSKSRIAKHAINQSLCIRCGTCAAVCPVQVIDVAAGKIDRDRCIACFGCLNNCPTEAMEMEMSGAKLYGFNKFKARKGIVTTEPAELRDKPAAAAPHSARAPEADKK